MRINVNGDAIFQLCYKRSAGSNFFIRICCWDLSQGIVVVVVVADDNDAEESTLRHFKLNFTPQRSHPRRLEISTPPAFSRVRCFEEFRIVPLEVIFTEATNLSSLIKRSFVADFLRNSSLFFLLTKERRTVKSKM